MEHEYLPLIIELCHIAQTRNDINVRRHRARWRKNYYSNAIAVVEAHNGTNHDLRYLRSQIGNGMQNKINEIESHMRYLVKKYPKPKKWKEMGLHKLRSLMLQGIGEYAMAKHETMELSIRERAKVKSILAKVGGYIYYDNGSVDCIGIGNTTLRETEIKEYAVQYQLNKAIETMVEEQYAFA